jgi:hypothetical protein
VPLLATSASALASDPAAEPARDRTQVLTGTVPATHVAEPDARASSHIDRMGDALAAQLHRLVHRARELTPSQRGVAAVIAALVLFLIILAVLDPQGGSQSEISSTTPAELRAPLQELHDAVNGNGG